MGDVGCEDSWRHHSRPGVMSTLGCRSLGLGTAHRIVESIGGQRAQAYA
jgi:hypothetical protein